MSADYTPGRMARPKKPDDERRVYINARILPRLFNELDDLTRDGNPSRSQAVEHAIAAYLPTLRKSKHLHAKR